MKKSLHRFALAAFAAIVLALSVNAQTPNQAIKLWADAAPGAIGNEPADVPTLTPYLPPRERMTGAAVVICPGGGYQMLADHEGRPVAEWLNSIGVAAFVLKYRIAPRYHHPAPMLDAQRALRTVRARAAEWGIDPRRIGILGFSAGGHLASTAATHFDAGKAGSADVIERVSSRPDLVILCSSDTEYPALAESLCPKIKQPVMVAGNPAESKPGRPPLRSDRPALGT